MEALLRDHGEDRGDEKCPRRRRGRCDKVPTREARGGVGRDHWRVRGLEGCPVHRRQADAEHSVELRPHHTGPVPGRGEDTGLRAVRPGVPVRG